MSGSHSPSSAPSAVGSGFGEFFRYHGWLAPGVRLFRRIRFPGKAAMVALAFLLPLVVALATVWTGGRQQIAFTQAERQGLDLVRPALSLVTAAQDRRRAATHKASDLAETQAAVRSAFEALAAAARDGAGRFQVETTWKTLNESHQALLQNPVAASADASFQQHSAFIDQALDLVRSVAGHSHLTLDPDLVTNQLVQMSIIRGPLQTENTARLRGMGSLILQSRDMSRERRDQIVRWHALWGYLDDEVEHAYQQSIEQFPDVAGFFDMKGTDEANDAFRKAIEARLLGAEITGEAADFQALGTVAVDKQALLTSMVMGRLDAQLELRAHQLQRTLWLQLGLSALCVVIAGYLMLAFYKVMMGGLHEVAGHLNAIADGNLTSAPTPWGKDEAAQLMLALGRMQQTLRRVVAAVLDGSGQVQLASEEISSATQDLSSRAEQSAASLQQTASSTQQIAHTVQTNTDTVHDALALARDNATAATRGGQVIGQVVQTMQDIRASSHRIGEIIGVIEGIAFQTNILALNAAVEAARAGEQGRGFAVVASEVRALAGRSSAAAKEIKTLIGTSLEQVGNGSKVVTAAGSTMGEIVGHAGRIAELMDRIAAATQEQSTGVGQVGVAVRQLDETTQQNAALAEQTASATVALSAQARRLSDEVAFFRIPAQAGGRRDTGPVAARALAG